jgi:hypothetical protein
MAVVQNTTAQGIAQPQTKLPKGIASPKRIAWIAGLLHGLNWNSRRNKLPELVLVGVGLITIGHDYLGQNITAWLVLIVCIAGLLTLTRGYAKHSISSWQNSPGERRQEK